MQKPLMRKFSDPVSPTAASASTPSPTAGDGVWGAADVRAQGTIIFATSGAVIRGAIAGNALNFTIADGNGNSMPTGSTVEVTGAVGNSSGSWLTCNIQSNSSFAIANTVAPTITSS